MDLMLDSEDATAALARAAACLLRPGDAILLEGRLGAGKTAFARALLRAAANDPALEVPSPSYTLVQSYEAAGLTLHHFDLWRLDSAEGLIELGWDDARADVVLVEWPERLGDLAPAHALRLRLTPTEATTRHVAMQGWPDRMEALLAQFRLG